MPLPARRIPESVAHLDFEAVAAALIRHDANVSVVARGFGVPSWDLRKLVLMDSRLAAAGCEAVELRLDAAEANLHQALRSEDPRRRDAVSMFLLRNTQRAAKRGYAVGSGAASLAVSVGGGGGDQAPTVVWARWMTSDGERRAPAMEEVERDGRRFSVPRYDAERRGIVEGEVAGAPALIERGELEEQELASEPVAVTPAPEPEPVVLAPGLSEPPARPELDLGLVFRERFKLLSRANDSGEGRLRAIEHAVNVARRELGLDFERAKQLVLVAVAKG
jgi:hypothetical protein